MTKKFIRALFMIPMVLVMLFTGSGVANAYPLNGHSFASTASICVLDSTENQAYSDIVTSVVNRYDYISAKVDFVLYRGWFNDPNPCQTYPANRRIVVYNTNQRFDTWCWGISGTYDIHGDWNSVVDIGYTMTSPGCRQNNAQIRTNFSRAFGYALGVALFRGGGTESVMNYDLAFFQYATAGDAWTIDNQVAW